MPYWLPGDDDEICRMCDSPHASVMTVRCDACDEFVCQFCVVRTEEATYYCSTCVPHRRKR